MIYNASCNNSARNPIETQESLATININYLQNDKCAKKSNLKTRN